MKDDEDKKWEPELITRYIVKHCKEREEADGKFDYIVSFDADGVDGNEHNIALHSATK